MPCPWAWTWYRHIETIIVLLGTKAVCECVFYNKCVHVSLPCEKVLFLKLPGEIFPDPLCFFNTTIQYGQKLQEVVVSIF
jgi:hypothetical protein